MGRKLYGGSILETWESRIEELEKEVERLGRENKRLQWEAGQEDRVEELEEEIERLKGRETLAGFLTTTLRKAAEGTPLEFPKMCGCGASVREREKNCGPWSCRPVNEAHTFFLEDGWHCIKCGEELKA